MTRLISTIVALVAAAGCAGVPAPMADRAGSPASASAPESPRTAFTAPELAPATAGRARSSSPLHDRGASSEHETKADYTCSMHPEVHADAPGRCSLCGMHLVPEAEPRKP